MHAGVTSDIKGVRAAMDAANHPALLLVDGVSSIGALEFKFDDWRVDVAVTGSQKALSLPTGLALVCASDKVRWCALFTAAAAASFCYCQYSYSIAAQSGIIEQLGLGTNGRMLGTDQQFLQEQRVRSHPTQPRAAAAGR
jgi:aspartate aminotransferase-like enzyme